MMYVKSKDFENIVKCAVMYEEYDFLKDLFNHIEIKETGYKVKKVYMSEYYYNMGMKLVDLE